MIAFMEEKFLATFWASFGEDFGSEVFEHLATLGSRNFYFTGSNCVFTFSLLFCLYIAG